MNLGIDNFFGAIFASIYGENGDFCAHSGDFREDFQALTGEIFGGKWQALTRGNNQRKRQGKGNTCQANLLDKQACSVCQQAGQTGRQGRQASEQGKGNITGHYVAFYVSKAT